MRRSCVCLALLAPAAVGAFAPPLATRRRLLVARHAKPGDTDNGAFDDPLGQAFAAAYDDSESAAPQRITWGVFKTAVDASAVPGSADRAALRAEAAVTLTNIDLDERQRRLLAGGGFGVATAALVLPTFFSGGFVASGRAGL